jgi:HAD superfamily hydrolase (TIGR01484 family)
MLSFWILTGKINFLGFLKDLRHRLNFWLWSFRIKTMKLLSQLTREEVQRIKLICFDADGVTVERGTEIVEKDNVLTVKTKQISPRLLEKIQRLKKYFHINFTSGRNLLYLARMFGPVLWERASIQAENGIFTLIDGQVIQTSALGVEELEKLEEIRREIKSLARTDENIQGFEPKQFMISVRCLRPDPQIQEIVRRIDTNGEFNIFWISNESQDIFLKRFNKGVGLEFLRDRLGLKQSEVMAVGNDPNDVPMLEAAGISVTTDPQNAQADFQTEGKFELGGEEVVDKLLELLE